MNRFPRGPRAAKYGAQHQRTRALLTRQHHPDHPCARCQQPLGPMGPWLHLDHAEDGSYLGFSHAHCNVHAGAVKGNLLSQRHQRNLEL